MVSHWVRWMNFLRNKLSLILMYFKLPLRLGVFLTQRQALPLCPELHVCTVRNAMMWAYCCYSMDKRLDFVLEFLWDLTQYLELNKYTWGQYSPVHQSVSWVAQDLSNLGVLCLSSWMELWKLIIKNHIELWWDMTSFWVDKQIYLSFMKWWVNNIDPWTLSGLPLG